MIRRFRAPSAPALALLMLLSGCGALGAVSEATVPLDAYTLQPLPGSGAGGGSLHLVVAAPEASGALATDRILIKPNAYQAQYLPEARWVDAAPVMVQTLLVGSLQNRGGFRLVGRDSAGLTPDYTLLTDLHAFEAEAIEVAPAPPPPPQTGPKVFSSRPEAPPEPVLRARVSMTLTLLREDDRALVSTRRFTQTAQAAAPGDVALVQAFQTASRAVLSEAASWAVNQTR